MELHNIHLPSQREAKNRKMKLNCKILTVVMLCVSALVQFALADLGSELRAEAQKLMAAVDSWKKRCGAVDKNSPQAKPCAEEYARLEAWQKSFQARVKAAGGQ
jgi:hypothetical protein